MSWGMDLNPNTIHQYISHLTSSSSNLLNALEIQQEEVRQKIFIQEVPFNFQTIWAILNSDIAEYHTTGKVVEARPLNRQFAEEHYPEEYIALIEGRDKSGETEHTTLTESDRNKLSAVKLTVDGKIVTSIRSLTDAEKKYLLVFITATQSLSAQQGEAKTKLDTPKDTLGNLHDSIVTAAEHNREFFSHLLAALSRLSDQQSLPRDVFQEIQAMMAKATKERREQEAFMKQIEKHLARLRKEIAAENS